MDKLTNKIVNKNNKNIKILQFGEGNFLRAFVDWFIEKMNKQGIIDSHVCVVQPLPTGRVLNLKEQDGLYTLYLQGVENGKTIRNHEVIDVLSDFINPYTEYDRYLDYAKKEDLELVISNTTEAGIVLDKDDLDFSVTPNSFPSKVLALLKTRYDYFNHDKNKGLSFICCELIDNNAKKLKEVLLQLSELKGYDESFKEWINNSCHFSSTLVDRIVPGFPKNDIDGIYNELGYIDDNVVVGELFHLWVLENDEHIKKIFPVDKMGLNAIYVDSIKPYKIRKVRILNGCHTLMVPVSYLYGIDAVRESILDEYVGKFVKKYAYDVVIPTIDLDKDDLLRFANSVFDRYLNPFVRHELMSIALNSISKFKERVLPTLIDYYKMRGTYSKTIAFSLASLIVFYEGKRGEETIKLNDNKEYLEYIESIKNDNDYAYKFLNKTEFFDYDLSQINGFNDCVLDYYNNIKKYGMKKSLKDFVEGDYE